MRSCKPDSSLIVRALTVRVFEMPLATALQLSFGGTTARRLCLVEVHVDDNHGVGETWINYPSWAWRERVETIIRGVAPLLIGRDVQDIQDTHAYLMDALAPLGRQWGARGPIWQAISGVDMALWDLHAKRAGRPISRLLSDAPRERVPVYASGIGPDRVEALAETAMSMGHAAFKVRVGFGRSTDRRTIRSLCSVVGNDAMILADANCAWDVSEAQYMCTELASLGVRLCEEPLQNATPRSLQAVYRQSHLPIAVGENVYTLDAFRRYAAANAVVALQPDVAKTGGITTAAQVDAIASAHGKRVSPHCYGGAVALLGTLQLSAALDSLGLVETDVQPNPLRVEPLQQELKVVDGWVDVPTGPGLGVVCELDRLRPYEIYSVSETSQ